MIRRKSKKVEMNVSAFADIAFLLIIFFVLTTTFVKDTGTEIRIPSADSDNQTEESKVPTINLTTSSIIITEGSSNTPMEFSRFQEWLEKKNFHDAEGDAKMVILQTEEGVTYQRYFTVFNSINNAGGLMVLMTDEEEGEGKE